MKITKYQPENIKEVYHLFYQTIHLINAKDYSKIQLDAWAPKNPNWSEFHRKLSKALTYLAWIRGNLAGFGSLANYNYLVYLFVSHLYQHRNVAYSICSHLEKEAIEHHSPSIYTDASITARPFFEKFGFEVVKEQTVKIRNINFRNFKMKKALKVL